MTDTPNSGKDFDQSLLDVFVSGYSSGMITALVRLGFDQDAVSAAVSVEVRAMARDPGYTADLLEMLHTTWELTDPDDPVVGQMKNVFVHIDPNTFT